MKKSFCRLTKLSLAIALALPATAMATNGYFAHGYGTKNKGLAGGGVALPQDAMIAATNPAGMVWVGERMDLGAAVFAPFREYTASTPQGSPATGFPNFPVNSGQVGTVESDSNYFVIPHFGMNWMLDSNSSLGVTVYGNGGMNTDYPSNVLGSGAGTFSGANAGVDLAQLFINGTYARKINDKSSWGVSAIFAYQRFKATGLAPFAGFSSDGNSLSERGYDDSYGYGVKIGWQGEIASGVTLGASYQTEMGMDEFDKYKGLFAEQGDFDIPATWTVGLAWNITPKNVFTFDVQKIMYSDIAAIANPLIPNLGTAQLGNDNGAGFGWEDMTVYKLGYQWESSPDWTWRVGYSYGEQPIPSSEVLFNILAPAVVESHLTFGFTWNTSPTSEFNFAAMYAPESSVTGVNPLDGQTIELTMYQYEVEASWAWKF